MRRFVNALVVLSGVLCLGLSGDPDVAGAAFEDGANQTGGRVVDGTPVAVAVRGPDGGVGEWRRPGGGSGPRWTCAYHGTGDVSTVYEVVVIEPEPTSPRAGRLYVLMCRDAGGALVQERFVVYDPGDPLGGLVGGERAAERALERLDLPAPSLVLNPPGHQVLGIPTWLAVASAWESSAASASVSSVTATVVARPTAVTWSLGDGTELTCDGPGKLFDAARPADEQWSECTHTYIWPSSGEGSGEYQVTATVSYEVSWTATDGSSGSLGSLARTTTQPVRVVEIQALIR